MTEESCTEYVSRVMNLRVIDPKPVAGCATEKWLLSRVAVKDSV